MKTTRIKMSKESLSTRFADAQRQIRDGENLRARGQEYIETLREWAREDGLAKELYALEHPAPLVQPVWELTKRVRVVKAFSVYGQNPYRETEVYAAGADAVVDLPLSVIKRLGAGVEVVPADTELRTVQAPGLVPSE